LALPAGEEHDPGHRGRYMAKEATNRLVCDLVVRDLARRVVTRQHHVRLEQDSFRLHALVPQLREDRVQRSRRDLEASLERVVAVHQHLRLHDRDEARLLYKRRITGKRVRIRPDAVLTRDLFADRDHRAPFGEPRAELAVLGESLAQAVEPLGDRLAFGKRERLGAGVDLDAGNDPLRLQQLWKWDAVGSLLSDRLVVEDHAADLVVAT